MRSRRVSALTAALALCATLTTPAAAETRILFSSGAWSAFGGTADDGRRVCGVITGGPHGKTMAITYFQGTSFLEVQIGKTSWAIPDGTRVRMTLQFGNGAPWVAPGRGRGNVVYGRIAGDQVRAFMTELRAAGSGVLEFLDGNEGSWAIDLTGSGSAVVVMMQCAARLIDGGRSTQPYGGSGVGTQPHGSTPPAPAPAPSQPFGKGPGRNT